MEIRQLTSTRFFAALTIVAFHFGKTAFPFKHGLLQHAVNEGSFAVSYFFCLSGYILAHVYYNAGGTLNKKEFYLRRFARIYPLYFLGFALALVSGIVLYHAIPKGNSILLQAFGLHAWVPGICLEINFPAWSLSVELFFYLCFPFLISRLERMATKSVIAVTAFIWIASAAIHIVTKSMDTGADPRWGDFVLYNPLLHINTFITGIASCILVKRGNINWSNASANCIFIASALTLFFIVAIANPIVAWIHNGLLAPLFALIIISLQQAETGVSTVFSWQPLVFLGNISYALYILQHPVREWFEAALRRMNASASTTAAFYFYLIALILISAFAFLYIEKPLRQRITNRYYKTL